MGNPIGPKRGLPEGPGGRKAPRIKPMDRKPMYCHYYYYYYYYYYYDYYNNNNNNNYYYYYYYYEYYYYD